MWLAIGAGCARSTDRRRQQWLLITRGDQIVECEQGICFGQTADPRVWQQHHMRAAARRQGVAQVAVEGGKRHRLQTDLPGGVMLIELIDQPAERLAWRISTTMPQQKRNEGRSSG